MAVQAMIDPTMTIKKPDQYSQVKLGTERVIKVKNCHAPTLNKPVPKYKLNRLISYLSSVPYALVFVLFVVLVVVAVVGLLLALERCFSDIQQLSCPYQN